MFLQRFEAQIHREGNRCSRWLGHTATQAVCALLIGLSCGAEAAERVAGESKVDFLIPAQPLVSAISRYGDVTGSEGLYDASLASGRYSNDVQGVMTPSEGLERLLVGTGLSARVIARGKFVVKSLPPPSGPMQQSVLSSAHRRYYGVLQQGVLDALCGSDEARPGHYRIIVTLRIAPNGSVEDARRIGTTGTTTADLQVDAALRVISFNGPPPEGFAQPIRILLAPALPGGTPACAGADHRLGASGGPR
jgi:hypothetical protein